MSDAARKGLRFRPRARLMTTLGRELISSDTVALTELVKNAYDANARFVVVRICGTVGADGAIVPETGSISVLDDGHGMDEDRIVDTWLEPATSFRRSRGAAVTGRRVLGEKGVGRFSAAKLGDRMELTSKVIGSEEAHLSLDWRDFDDDSKYLEDVELDLQVGASSVFAAGGEAERAWQAQPDLDLDVPNRPATGHGTLITVTSLHSRWTSGLLKELRRALSMLVSPFAEDRGVVDSFKICLDVPNGLGAYGGVVTSADLLKQHHYSLSAAVEANGAVTVLLTLKDGSELEQELVVRNSDSGERLRCGAFEIFLYVWDRDPASMKNLADYVGGRKLAKDALDSASGVSIYRDGFRVLPYGEKGDDWLGLDARRVQNPTLRLSNNQIVGYILIGRDTNPRLVDQSNREGLVDAPALADLQNVVRVLLGTLETERYQFRPRRPRRTGSLLEPMDLGPLREAVDEVAPGDTRIQSMMDDTQRAFDDHLSRMSEVLSRYHRLATLGKLIDMVVHELTHPIFAIRQATSLGIQTLEAIPDSARSQFGDIFHDLDHRFRRTERQTAALNTIVRRIEPFGGRRRGQPTRYVVEDAILETVDLLAPQVAATGATITLPETTHTVTIDRVELQEILINLLDNSLYWLDQSRKAAKVIEVSVMKNDDESLSIVIEDSGPGIPKEHQDSIFQPYFTTKSDGVGLGLAIAGEMVEDYYGGSLELLPSGHLGGARFRATLRKRVT